MPDWSIEIVEKDSVTSFNPSNQNALLDDLVSWNNTTGKQHQPWMLDANGKPVPDPRKGVDPNQPISPTNPLDPKSRLVPTYMSDLILPGASSRPAFDVAQPVGSTNPISYYCREHPDDPTERGTITVTT